MADFLKSLTQDKALSSNVELLQQIALRNYLNNGEESKQFYQLITTGRIVNELYQRMTGTNDVTVHKKQCIANIVEYIKNNPNASNNALKKEVELQIGLFAAKIS